MRLDILNYESLLNTHHQYIETKLQESQLALIKVAKNKNKIAKIKCSHFCNGDQ